MDEKNKRGLGIVVPELLLPRSTVDMSKWAVVACDQHSSQPEYWEAASDLVKDAPSTLRIILPECYLEAPDIGGRIERIDDVMLQYLSSGVLQSVGQGLMLVRREAAGRTRLGLVLALDLEQYDYSPDSQTLIRATEGTIVGRIPPRLAIRKGAALELPHVLALIDDPGHTVIAPLMERVGEPAYDFDLMLGGGHITGYLLQKDADIAYVFSALEALVQRDTLNEKYGEGVAPLLVAIGDGNHSVATAKALWEDLKDALPEEALENHPARYCLVELVNVHDQGLIFESINRVLFDADNATLMPLLCDILSEANGGCSITRVASQSALFAQVEAQAVCEQHLLPFVDENGYGYFSVNAPAAQLEVGTLQNALDAVVKAMPGARVDYIHGSDVVAQLGSKPGCLGFFLPKMDKTKLFPTIIYDGVLPRKTFSMGEANEKRYYFECRKIVK